MAAKTSSTDASVWRTRTSRSSVPPDHSGSVAYLRKGCRSALVKVVGTSLREMTPSAKLMAWRRVRFGGPSKSMVRRSRTTTSFTRLSTSGRASEAGTGVTRPTQWLERRGVRNGTMMTWRRLRPASSA
jgi:hypothetical protein